jgi:hypothetical protein
MKDARFEELREGIYQELLKANQHFKIFWGMRLASKDIAKVMNVYLTFFYYTMWCNNDRFCLGIYNVIKPDKDTANFTKLFNYIISNENLSKIFNQREINKMEVIIQSHKNLIDRIKVVRDQYIAHNQLTKNHLKEDTTYKYEEGEKLLKDLNKILDKLSYKYDNSRYWHDNSGLLDVSPGLNLEDMLRDLTEHRNDQIKRTREAVKHAQTSYD